MSWRPYRSVLCGAVGVFGAPATPYCFEGSTDRVEIASPERECVVCHEDEWRMTELPAHEQAAFGRRCGECHDQGRWAPAPGFAHTEDFPLEAGHDGVACQRCHTLGPVADAPLRPCAACHGDRAAQVADPVHAGLPADCAMCHDTGAFRPSRFTHGWPLEGTHALITCRACHAGDDQTVRYEQTSTRCIDCHQAHRALADGRVAGHSAFPETCEQCHGFDAFRSR